MARLARLFDIPTVSLNQNLSAFSWIVEGDPPERIIMFVWTHDRMKSQTMTALRASALEAGLSRNEADVKL